MRAHARACTGQRHVQRSMLTKAQDTHTTDLRMYHDIEGTELAASLHPLEIPEIHKYMSAVNSCSINISTGTVQLH